MMQDARALPQLPAGHQIGRYTVTRLLGRGGMGVVYVARDERLGRDVALKMIAGLTDDDSRSRFWREARAAASVSHPHICQVFEVDEAVEGVFLTMELMEGEGLDTRLARGALAPKEAVPITVGVLGALGALHARGLLHRDVKPSNIFITTHGPKLLDFGLARRAVDETVRLEAETQTAITEAGMILGTPHYMAPEQVTGAKLDGRTDLYAIGAVLFQMLAGRPPFGGIGVDAMFAALHENPPALQGPSEVVAVDRVIRRAMRKDPSHRHETAEQMAAELAAIPLSGTSSAMAVPIRALTRIVVPPMRIAKTDPDVAFLSFGLAESVSGSLASLGDVVVRAPAMASKWNEDSSDPRRLAAEADVDLVVSSTLLRSGSRLRVTLQLLDATSGTVLGSSQVKGTLDDIFAVEDAFTTATMTLLSTRRLGVSMPAVVPPARRDVPANPRAFELFLRGMEHARHLTETREARAILEEAVREDPGFAPAWAALARCHRVYGKYYSDAESNDRLAEDAFRRALELNPDLPIAHRYLTHFEAERGRAGEAIARLLRHAHTNRNDAQLFAGLVHACRYAGLIDASIAADEEARRLDPNVSTGVGYSLAHLWGPGSGPHIADRGAQLAPDVLFAMGTLGSADAARESLRHINLDLVPPKLSLTVDALAAMVSKPASEAAAVIERAIAGHTDPEALFLLGLMLVRTGATARGLAVIGGAVQSGYSLLLTLNRNPVFDGVRADPVFLAIESDARQGMTAARAVFEREDGRELLGMREPA